MDVITDSTTRRVTLMWAAQTGKSETALTNPIGYYISQDPKSILVMQPTQKDLKTWIIAKLDPMLTDTPIVRERVAKPRGREGVNNQEMKSYPGGFLMFSWSGSPNTMRSRSAPIILCDEIDGYERTSEGDPVELLWQRAATFGEQAKLIESSTPTIKGASAIEKAYEASDMRRYHMPCPTCEETQTFKWGQVKWDKSEETVDDKTGEITPPVHLPNTARYICEHCEATITDGDKAWMLRRGKWVAEKPFMGHAGFHLSELYSPFRKWRDIVESFLSKKRSGNMQTFVNVSLAETWSEGGITVEPGNLFIRREHYTKVPEKAVILTCGVDVQDDRLEAEVFAWAEGEEVWSMDVAIFYGDPGRAELWNRLGEYLTVSYEHESGSQMRIVSTCVDSGGHYTNETYKFCKGRAGVHAIKGKSQQGAPIVNRPSTANMGKVPLFSLGVDTAKELIYARLKVTQPGHGYCHFPVADWCDEEYFAQLTAEKYVSRFHKGFESRTWIKTRPRNEALDRRVYGYAALLIANPAWSAIKDKFNYVAPPPAAQETPVQQMIKNRNTHGRKRGGFVNRWR